MRSEVMWPTIPAMLRHTAQHLGDADAVVDGTRRVDFNTLRALVDDGKGGVTMVDTGAEGSSISSFGETNGGALYVLSLSDGVFRVAAG